MLIKLLTRNETVCANYKGFCYGDMPYGLLGKESNRQNDGQTECLS